MLQTQRRNVNYRHSFHAGNFADVIKHVALMRVLEHLKAKPTPFRVIDTHAGAGFYDLIAGDAARTGEWIEGIGRLYETHLDEAAEGVLAPYRQALATLAPDRQSYAGSPALIRHALRPDDRATFNELHPETCIALKRALPRDNRIAITPIDGYMAWKAQIPPREKRGLVLVDPPFEKDDEFARMAEGARMMAQKWPTGTLMLWYPIKSSAAVTAFERALTESGLTKLLIVELHVDRIEAGGPLAACGLAIANPPWTLAEDLSALLPGLSSLLARRDTARWRVDWLAAA